METKKIMEIVLGGVVMGLTVGIGINLSNRLMGKIGRKEDEVVMTTKSEMLGGMGKKIAGRKSCQMPSGEYVLVNTNQPCVGIGGKEV
jgi:hypothetical protein